jgi:4-amino-4-deoxy-L-arabinose transferase-like glycosyltransferase
VAWLGRLWDERPLAVVIGLAIAVRLAAALLSRGYGMHDDHFFVVELAQRWADGHWNVSDEMVAMRSLVYPWLHAALFRMLQGVGLDDPADKMLVVRLLHAAWSLLTVWFGYRIALAISDSRKARLAGLLLALFWIQPFMSVRNLIEVVCQPLLLAAAWLLVRGGDPAGPRRGRDAFAAGLLLGLAFVVRFQTLILAAATGLVLLALRRIRAALLLGTGVALAGAVVLGLSDWLGFGRPFASLIAYLSHNSTPAIVAAYPHGPWYQYLGLLAGVLIPPMSLLFLYGWARTWRTAPLLFWPALAFLAFHSAYPGKQERFILPIFPVVLLLCSVGWQRFAERSPFWARRPRLLQGLWTWFWAVNAALLVLYTANYSKNTRVESLSFLRGCPDLRGLVWETCEASVTQPPLFYLHRDVPVYALWAGKTMEALRADIPTGSPGPSHAVLMGTADLQARLRGLETLLPGLTLERTVTPSAYDRLLHWLNPKHNVNLTAYVYRAAGTGRCRP